MFYEGKRSSGLWGRLPKISQHLFFNKIDFSSSIDTPRDQKTFSLYQTLILSSPKGSRGPFMPWDQYFRQYLQCWPTFWHLRLKTIYFWMTFDLMFFSKVNRVRWGYYCVWGLIDLRCALFMSIIHYPNINIQENELVSRPGCMTAWIRDLVEQPPQWRYRLTQTRR